MVRSPCVTRTIVHLVAKGVLAAMMVELHCGVWRLMSSHDIRRSTQGCTCFGFPSYQLLSPEAQFRMTTHRAPCWMALVECWSACGLHIHCFVINRSNNMQHLGVSVECYPVYNGMHKITFAMMSCADTYFKQSVPSPAREPTAAGDERHESIGREEPCGLAGVALVAALLLSTSSTKSTNPAGASTARNYFDSTRRECCSYEIALAFAVAATQWTHMPCCDFATGIDGSDRRGARHGFSCHMTGGERGTAPLKTVSIPGESCSSQSRYGMTARADDCGCGQSQHSGNDSARSTDIPGTTERVVNHGKAVQQARRRSAACGDRGQHAVGKVRRAPNGQTTQATGGKVGNRSRKEAREPTSATAAPCEACLSKYVFELIRRDDAREANIGKIDRRFINLWSHVQSAVWHVNACHSILGLQQPRRLSGEASSSSKQRHNVGDVVLDPLRLRPALALLVYRRRRRLHRSQQYQRQSGPNSQMQNEQLPSENVARTRRHRRGSLPPTSEPSLQTDYLGSLSNSAPRKQLEREQHVRPDRDGRRSDSASNTGQGVRDSRGLISSLRPRRHPRQVAHTRRAGSSGIEGRRQELTEDKSVAWVVVEGCKGTCAWARRVRTVMEAATS